MSSFPWTYDQLQRYVVLRFLAAEQSRAAGPAALRVLDVGGAATDRSGAGLWLPARAILSGPAAPGSSLPPLPHSVSLPAAVRVAVADVSARGTGGYVRASGRRLPFPDESFDIVSALDVLEHIPKDERDAFLAELGRVASRAVLLGCPTKSPGVEQAEALLNSQILRLYGVEHSMLVEHRANGLPRPEEIEAGLARAGLASVSFGYGALSTWLSNHMFRASFILRRESDEVTREIDRFWAGQPQSAELEAPFYRRFWIGSKTIDREGLERMAAAITAGLRNGLEPVLTETGCGDRPNPLPSPSRDGPEDAFDSVERAARRILARPSVSALVVTGGEPPILGPCLDALLVQVTDLDFEVAVWNFADRPDTAAFLRARYPQVRLFSGAFMDIVPALRGDRIFLLDERFQPAPDAAARYVARTDPAPMDAVLAVSAPWRGGFPPSWTGRARSSWKKSRGLMVKAGVIGRTSHMGEDDALVPRFKGWVIGDGLFFRRIALAFRNEPPSPDRHTVFLWEFK